MKPLYKLLGFFPYILIIFLNATVDLGHKIIIQNTLFKAYDGTELIIYTAIINALILLPFVFLFSPSGFLSDKYNKTKVIKVASFVAIIITSFVTLSYYQGWFEVAFFLTLLLAAQSAIYSPAKYGLIKELFGVKYLTSANATTQAVTIISILLGALVYSYFFEMLLADQSINKSEILTYIAPLGFILIASSIVEFLLSLKLPKTQITQKNAKTFSIKKYATLQYFKQNRLLTKRDNTIWYSIVGLSIFWAISQIVIAVFGAFLKSSLDITNTVTAQGILSLGGLGIVVGSIIAAKISKRYIETGIIPIGSIGIAITLAIIPQLNTLVSIGIVFFVYGICAGLLIVPLNSLIQFSAPNFRLGKILAANNYYQNITMFVALVITAYVSYLGVNSAHILTATAIFAGVGGLWTLYKLPQSLIRYIFKFFFGFKYKIDVFGLENIPNNKGVLLLGNHISYLDWAILQIAYPKQIRFVMEKSIYNRWYAKWFFSFFKIIPISQGGSKNALNEVTKALNNGDTVALFPEGYLSRNGQINNFLKGYEHALTDVKKVLIVPFYLHGLWENKFSLASKKVKNDTEKISIFFGEPLASDTKAEGVKDKVVDLSVLAWDETISQSESIARVWLNRIKKEKNFFVADSTGMNLNNNRFLTATLIMRSWFKKPLKKQQNIGVILPSSVAGSMANMALFTLAKTPVNLNCTTGVAPLQSAIKNAEIKTIITSRKFINKLAQKGFELDEVLKTSKVIYLEDMKAFAHKLRALSYLLCVLIFPTNVLKLLFTKKQDINETAVILFSSGSESSPKGIQLSHKNIIANVKQIKRVIIPNDKDVLVGTLPIFHSFGLTVCTLLPQLEGVPVVYHPDPTDGYGVGKLVAQYKGTILLGTATFLRLYVRNKKCQPLMFQTINKVIAGAEKLSEAIRLEFKQKFSLDILEGYGATETAPVASCNVPDQLIPNYWKLQQGQKHGTIGKALAGTKIIITDPNTFETLPIGQEGMILISGPQVMQGYLNDKDKTDEVIKIINNQRYYVTGDKGKIDGEGFITIVDRYSRFAKIAGEMISLTTVEMQIQAQLKNDSDITIDLCATNLPDVKKGEKIILLYNAKMSEIELKNILLASDINPLYIPNDFILVNEIPKLGTGKMDFNTTKKMALKHYEES
jgi:acyl-[acyl-carrier-protein]-phospholipid O-acyltransferase/long-chain-fatty-acid--[acyl-carrier-protein] ligase